MNSLWTDDTDHVGAFDTAAAILVVAFMIIPPNIAQLLTQRLSHMLIASCLIAMVTTLAGASLFMLQMPLSLDQLQQSMV